MGKFSKNLPWYGLAAAVAAWLLTMRSTSDPATSELRIEQRPGTFDDGFGTRKSPPAYIVLHYTLTASPESTVKVLRAKHLSTSYEVSRTGEVYEYLDPAKHYPYASGAGNNSRSIAIDFTALEPGDPWPPAQIAAGRALIAYLCKKYGIPNTSTPEAVRGWDQNAVIEHGYGTARHRNVRATKCPGDLPVEQMVKFSTKPAMV